MLKSSQCRVTDKTAWWNNAIALQKEHYQNSETGISDYQELGCNYKADKCVRQVAQGLSGTGVKWTHVKCTNAAPTNYTGHSFRDNKRKKNWGFFSLANARYWLTYAYYSRARRWVKLCPSKCQHLGTQKDMKQSKVVNISSICPAILVNVTMGATVKGFTVISQIK